MIDEATMDSLRLNSLLNTIHQSCDKECDEKRKFMLPIWKRAEFYWNDVQDLFWREDIHDWRTFEDEEGESEINAIRDNNKIVNIYRAYGESIIAAATIGNLSLRFFPENADNPSDLDKSRSYSDISDYIQRVNNIRELRRRAFTIRWNQGLVASYVFYEKNKKKYGYYKRPAFDVKNSLIETQVCQNPECDYEEPSKILDTPEAIEQDADQAVAIDEATLNEIPQNPVEQILCPRCNNELTKTTNIEETPYVTGEEEVEKGCSTIKLYTPLQLKIPFYATDPSEIDCIIVETEVHYTRARELFPEYADKINPGNVNTVESTQREQADVYGEVTNKENVTISRLWCKPSRYWVVSNEPANMIDDVKALRKKFPEGLYQIKIGEEIIEPTNVDLDKHWSFVRSPLDSHVYIRALGNSTIPIQDMENDLVYLTMDTIRHGIGETFYDSRILDQKRYKDQRAQPGNKYPVNLQNSNRPISEFFHHEQNATLSQEVDRFHDRLQSRGQLVSGALPSIWGGQFEEGSKTLGVYELSRAQALQRIVIPTNGIDDFLAETVHKATVLYDENMEGDEPISVEDGSSYKSTILSKAPPDGKIARVEVVKSEQFPTTWEQKRAFIMELLDKQIEPINQTLFWSQNISLMSRIIGIPELKVPGDADRNKQLHIIQQLLAASPIPPDPMAAFNPANKDPETGQINPMALQPTPSVPPDLDVDNHRVCFETAVEWAISPEGIRSKNMNPEGYMNVILNLRAHKMILDQQAAEQAMAEAERNKESKPPSAKKEEQNV